MHKYKKSEMKKQQQHTQKRKKNRKRITSDSFRMGTLVFFFSSFYMNYIYIL